MILPLKITIFPLEIMILPLKMTIFVTAGHDCFLKKTFSNDPCTVFLHTQNDGFPLIFYCKNDDFLRDFQGRFAHRNDIFLLMFCCKKMIFLISSEKLPACLRAVRATNPAAASSADGSRWNQLVILH